MEDVQNSPAPVALPIDRVGVKGLKLPLLVRDRMYRICRSPAAKEGE